jgi:hypothetical protein
MEDIPVVTAARPQPMLILTKGHEDFNPATQMMSDQWIFFAIRSLGLSCTGAPILA